MSQVGTLADSRTAAIGTGVAGEKCRQKCNRGFLGKITADRPAFRVEIVRRGRPEERR